MAFSVIYADPPWQYRQKAGQRGAAAKYPVQSLEWLKSLPVQEISAADSVLFLWCVPPMLPEALELMTAWGFQYRTKAFAWVKQGESGALRWGMGAYTRANTEDVLLGVRGKLPRVSRSVHQVIRSAPGRHSEKPEEVRKRIEMLYGDVPRVELFSRRLVAGWECWGDEFEGVDIKCQIESYIREEKERSADKSQK